MKERKQIIAEKKNPPAAKPRAASTGPTGAATGGEKKTDKQLPSR